MCPPYCVRTITKSPSGRRASKFLATDDFFSGVHNFNEVSEHISHVSLKKSAASWRQNRFVQLVGSSTWRGVLLSIFALLTSAYPETILVRAQLLVV